jgi:enoyl-CoA hydratase/carnithine racemase
MGSDERHGGSRRKCRVTTERVNYVTQGTTAVIEIGDGTRRNSLGRADWNALARLVDSVSGRPDVCAIVLTGRGETFSAGSDMNDWMSASLIGVEQTFKDMEACFQVIERSPVPVFAAIEGVAAGAGCQLALACDLVVMSGSGRIGMPVARLGILASAAFVARVSRRAGKAMAADLYLTGRLLTAEESLSVGLVTRVVPTGSALAETMRIAESIAATPASALVAAKLALGQVEPTCGGSRAPGSAATAAAPTVAYEDFSAAVRAFLPSRLAT